MTTIYGIDESYDGKIKLITVEAKETKKLYKFGNYYRAFGYTSQLHKDDKRISLSEQEAVDKYTESKQLKIKSLKKGLEEQEKLLAQAKELLKCQS